MTDRPEIDLTPGIDYRREDTLGDLLDKAMRPKEPPLNWEPTFVLVFVILFMYFIGVPAARWVAGW